MNLAAIRKEARFRLKDMAKPYFFTDEFIDSAANEAVQEACIRARLIEDDSSEAARIDITTDAKRYRLHGSVIDVIRCEIEWRPGIPFIGWDLNESDLILDDYPSADGVLALTVIRTPLAPMEKDDDEPEIGERHHRNLIGWIEYRAYSVPDADLFNPNGAALGYARFEAEFGKRPDANVQRKHRRKSPRVVRMNPF